MRPRVATFVVLLAACSTAEKPASSEGDVGGTLVIVLPAEPSRLVPPLVRSTNEKEIADQIFDVLAEIGPGRNTVGDAGFTPRLAQSWTWSADSLSIAFRIDPRARWHDGIPVTARDVQFSLELYRDPAVGSQLADAFEGVDSISVPDSLTAVAWYHRRSPEQFFALAFNLAVLPEHLLRDADRANLEASPFAQHPVGSGPFRFVRWEPRSLVEVVADSSYPLGRPKLDRIVWALNPDRNAAVTKVLVGEADVYEALTADAMARIGSSQVAQAVPFTSLNYGYLGFNQRDAKNPNAPHALFADAALRRALTMALDRHAMLVNVFDTLAYASFGPFSRNMPVSDTTIQQIPFDSAGADRLLDSLGWRDRNRDGMRDRGGRPLRFSLMVPAASLPRVRYAELIQAQLRSHGVRVDIETLEIPVFNPRMFAGQFDATINSWQVDPSPAFARAVWGTKPPRQRFPNILAYSNPAVDSLFELARNEVDEARVRDLYRDAYRRIVADAPAVWLYENKVFVAVNKRIHPVGQDADNWWRYLRLWWVSRG